MKILTRYLGSVVAWYILLVMLLLVGIQTFIEFTKEFPHIGTGSYGLLKVLVYVPMMLPSSIYQFFPMAGLLGCIIGLGLLSSHSELIVIRAAGVSLRDIIIAVAKSSLVLIVIIFIIGEIIAPIAERVANRYKTTAMSEGQALSTHRGMWVRSGNNFIHIDKVINKKNIKGITRYEFSTDRKLKSASIAESGFYNNRKWTFKNITQTTFADDDSPASAAFVMQQWDVVIDPNVIAATIDTNQKSLVQLYSYVKGCKRSGLSAETDNFIFWQRIFAPITTLIMILLGVPFVCGPLRRSSMGLRMVVGIICGFGFYLLNQFIGSISAVYHFSPFLAAISLPVIFINIGWILLNKIK